jgi:hypothetical protein
MVVNMNVRTIAALVIAILPVTVAGCAADTGEEDVTGDSGESLEESAEGSKACSADDMSTPECVQMMNAIQTAMNDALGPDDGTSQTSDEDGLHFDNTGTGSGSGGSGSGSSGGSGSGGSGSGSGSKGGSGSGSASGDGSGSGSGSSGDSADPKSGSTGGTTSRRDMLSKAQQWVKDKVMYSQSKYHNGYRQDCSGFVSMAWGVSKNLNTSSFAPYSKSVSHQLSDYNQLQPGDALNKSPRGHMFMFAGWANSAHTSMYIYEESHTGAPALYKSVPKSYFSHFVPIRKNGM